MMRRLNGWERIVTLVGVIGGVVTGYLAYGFYSLPEEPLLESTSQIRLHNEYESLNFLSYILRKSDIDASLAKEKQRRESICSTTSISVVERQLVCGRGVTRPEIINWQDIEKDLREKDSYKVSFELGFRDEHGSTLSLDQAVEKAKNLQPELASRIDLFYSIRSGMLAKEISDRDESNRQYSLATAKYYGMILLWIVIPGSCAYIFMMCFRWVRSGFSQS